MFYWPFGQFSWCRTQGLYYALYVIFKCLLHFSRKKAVLPIGDPSFFTSFRTHPFHIGVLVIICSVQSSLSSLPLLRLPRKAVLPIGDPSLFTSLLTFSFHIGFCGNLLLRAIIIILSATFTSSFFVLIFLQSHFSSFCSPFVWHWYSSI